MRPSAAWPGPLRQLSLDNLQKSWSSSTQVSYIYYPRNGLDVMSVTPVRDSQCFGPAFLLNRGPRVTSKHVWAQENQNYNRKALFCQERRVTPLPDGGDSASLKVHTKPHSEREGVAQIKFQVPTWTWVCLSTYSKFPKTKNNKAGLRWKRSHEESCREAPTHIPFWFWNQSSSVHFFSQSGFWGFCAWISSSLGSVDVRALLKWNLPCDTESRDMKRPAQWPLPPGSGHACVDPSQESLRLTWGLEGASSWVTRAEELVEKLLVSVRKLRQDHCPVRPCCGRQQEGALLEGWMGRFLPSALCWGTGEAC